MENKKEYNEEIGEIEDATKYGEFVSSYFAWMTLEGQKKRVDELDKMTRSEHNKKTSKD